jgi:hypothetical protein
MSKTTDFILSSPTGNISNQQYDVSAYDYLHGRLQSAREEIERLRGLLNCSMDKQYELQNALRKHLKNDTE